VDIPISGSSREQIGMTMYLGPNDFENLRAFGNNLEDVIPFGMSILGTINRWVIRPIFNVLTNLMDNKGLVILLLTLLVKILLYPLTYKMLHSQAKMSALKPQLTGLRERHKDDLQKQQMETMKVYREYGVSPFGGCLPMLLQMPIWIALYRFFPASIEFRQAKFLWATDLSSYDVLVNLPFTIPFYGAHVSMFTLLWAGTTVLYTYYSMKQMDMGAMGNNPMLKYMQYFMPVLFLFFFNNYASGLTLYLLFSNLVNIGLTLGTRKFIFNDERIMAELNLNKAKPKKRSAFSERLEAAMKEQQRIAQDRQKSKPKR
jgi:YidC/Oxa1 family membrane protein insertase